MRPLLACCLVLLAAAGHGAGMSEQVNEPADESELERDWLRDHEKKAARYRLERDAATAEERDDAAAKRWLDDARALLAEGHGRAARKAALKGFKRHPYSQHADDLQHV